MKSLQLNYQEPAHTWLHTLLFPILLPIKFIQALNRLIVAALWGELIRGERDHNPLITLLGATFFFIGSLYCYKYEDQLDTIILIFTILAVVDKLIVKFCPVLFERSVSVKLEEQTNGMIEWQSSSASSPRYFMLEQVKDLYVRKHEYQQGLIIHEEVETWELILSFKANGMPPLELYESKDMTEVQKVAVQLSQKFGLEWNQENEFNQAYKSQYSTPQNQVPNHIPNFSKSLKLSGDGSHFTLKPRLGIRGLFKILSRSFKDAGFIFFMVVLASFIKRFGKVLAGIYGPTFGVERPESEIYVVDSIFYFFRAFKPDFDPTDFFELGVASALIAIYIFNHFKKRSIEVNGHLCHARNGTKLSTFQTQHLKVKIIDPEENQILLHDGNDAIVLNNFGSLEDGLRIKRLFQSRQAKG